MTDFILYRRIRCEARRWIGHIERRLSSSRMEIESERCKYEEECNQVSRLLCCMFPILLFVYRSNFRISISIFQHDHTITALLHTLGAKKSVIGDDIPHYTATLVNELWKKNGEYFVKVRLIQLFLLQCSFSSSSSSSMISPLLLVPSLDWSMLVLMTQTFVLFNNSSIILTSFQRRKTR